MTVAASEVRQEQLLSNNLGYLVIYLVHRRSREGTFLYSQNIDREMSQIYSLAEKKYSHFFGLPTSQDGVSKNSLLNYIQ